MRNVAQAITAGLITLLIAACGGESSDNNNVSDGPQAVPVEVMIVQRGDVSRYVDAVGTVEALYDADISAETSGQLLSIASDVGSWVFSGDAVVILDDETQMLQLDICKAQLDIAEAAHEKAVKDLVRIEDLYASHDISESEFELTRLMAKSAKGELDLALASHALGLKVLDDTRISAPFDGEITAVYVDPGEMVALGQIVFTIVRTDTIEINVEVSVEDALSLWPGMDADIRSRSIPDTVFYGILHSVSVKASEVTKRYPVRVLVPNECGTLLPGMHTEIRIITGSISDAIIVPLDAILNRNGKRVVFVVENGVAVMREVSIVAKQSTDVVLSSGIAAGETLVVVGQHSLRDGQEVTITE